AEVGSSYGHEFSTFEIAIGGIAIDSFGVSLRANDLERCRGADAALLGAVGGPKWDVPDAPVRPEQGLLALRRGLGLYANLRPVRVLPALVDASPVKADVVRDTNLLMVRELTGGLYFGRPSRQWRERRGRAAVDTLLYREHEIARVARLAFSLAQGRRGLLVSVDKANVLATSRLWRSIVTEIGNEFSDVTLEHMLVDAMAMRLISHPSRFDVIVTENMFGDILTDEASVIAGSIGLLPSASIGKPRADGRFFGLFEPIHGSAPDISGQRKANPIGMILSMAMMLRISLGLELEAAAVEMAVAASISAGVRTSDISGTRPAASTRDVGDEVIHQIRNEAETKQRSSSADRPR
ncbi:MAG: 3-isopropylmalate dehydrogenase, partial [Chloroflexota bacterium]|nr:3-isopropylmalate dehydrogenase [Chloroflexota bacterium]